ncbi:hypothetical protein Tco_1354773 [Tanacetum coccineum]
MENGLQVKQKDDGIFISQDKYVANILKKFNFSSVKTAGTPLETNKALVKDKEVEDVDVHLYRSMIGSLMYLTASRPDIMLAICACARYLKGQPKLGLWYPRDSPFNLEAFFDNDYAGASLDRKSTTGGCQFLNKRLISWQCKKQTIMANSTTKAEYVAAANCCGQNPVFHSKTKHIEIRHHFIRDSYEKKLIQVIKIHTDQNVADLLTKAFDASRVKTAKVGDEAIHKELGDRMEKAATTASSLEAVQDNGIDGNLYLIEKRVLALKEEKTAQDRVITKLKLRVKRLEKKKKVRTPQPMKRRQFKGRVETSTDKSLVIVEDKGSGEKGGSTTDQVSTARPEVSAASVPMNVSAATPSTPPTTTTIFSDEDLTIAQTLVKIRSEKAKEKEKGVVLIDEEEPPRLNRSTTTLQPLLTIDLKDKGKGVLVKDEPEKPVKVKRRDQGRSSKKQNKLEGIMMTEKRSLGSMECCSRDDVAIDVESLATKYPIVDWKIHILNENMMYYQIIRVDGSSNNYKIFSEMLDDFDRQDVIDLHRLVNERYETTSPEGYDLLLWGDLKTLFEPGCERNMKDSQDLQLDMLEIV